MGRRMAGPLPVLRDLDDHAPGRVDAGLEPGGQAPRGRGRRASGRRPERRQDMDVQRVAGAGWLADRAQTGVSSSADGSTRSTLAQRHDIAWAAESPRGWFVDERRDAAALEGPTRIRHEIDRRSSAPMAAASPRAVVLCQTRLPPVLVSWRCGSSSPTRPVGQPTRGQPDSGQTRIAPVAIEGTLVSLPRRSVGHDAMDRS
jgi:hypothetical protein